MKRPPDERNDDFPDPREAALDPLDPAEPLDALEVDDEFEPEPEYGDFWLDDAEPEES